MLWRFLTDKNARESNNSDQTVSDHDIDGNYKFEERELKESSSTFPPVMYNVDGPNISSSDIVIVAPGESQIPVSFTLELDWEALAFPKDCSIERNHFNEESEISITLSKYVNARLKCYDRFAVNPQYIFHALDWIERNAVATSVHFTERKQFRSEMNVGQLVNHNNVRRMISDHQIFSLYFLSEELFSTFTICC